MKENYTDITVVLDRSGSMGCVRDDTIGGYNTFLAAQKAIPGDATITLIQFDHEYMPVMRARALVEAVPLDTGTYVPRGNTALLDAIGRTITDTGARLAALTEKDRPEKVVFVIITDGQENASSEFSQSKIKEMIEHQREKYKWEFVFLGANQDAIVTAASYGIPYMSGMSYSHTNVGTQSAFGAVTKNVASFRAAGATGQSLEFSSAQRAEQDALIKENGK